MAQQLSTSGLNRFRATPIGWLATSRPDGSPHLTPVWFVLEHGSIWIASARRNVKVRNLLHDPRASLAADGTAESGPLVAEGVVTVRAPDSTEVLDALREKYAGWDAADPQHDGERVLLELEVRRWLLAA